MPPSEAQTPQTPTKAGDRGELAPIDPLRSNALLSKLPVHQLSKKAIAEIRLINRSQPGGQIDTYWKVSANEEHGHPRQLAYRLDTLFINRRIDEAKTPFPRIMRLGSLREIARELGLRPEDTGRIKKALQQNSSAYISLKLPHPTNDGKYFEGHGVRYNLAVKGQTMPDGSDAETVYILWNEPFYSILNTTRSRPLDYSYLKSLSPGAQRFYELVSFYLFAAFKYGQSEAKLRYSDYCQQAPQNRYFSRQPAQNQMNGVHRHHKRSGYISKLRWQKTTDDQGKPDWFIFYTPGPKARAEYEHFTGKRPPRPKAISATTPKPRSNQGTGERSKPTSTDKNLLNELLHLGVTEDVARSLFSNADPAHLDHIRDCLDYWLAERSVGKDVGPGLLVALIRRASALPETFETRQERRTREAAEANRRQLEQEEARVRMAYQQFQKEAAEQYIADELSVEDREEILSKAKDTLTRQYDFWNTPERAKDLERMAQISLRKEVLSRLTIPTFEEFARQQKKRPQKPSGPPSAESPTQTIKSQDPPHIEPPSTPIEHPASDPNDAP